MSNRSTYTPFGYAIFEKPKLHIMTYGSEPITYRSSLNVCPSLYNSVSCLRPWSYEKFSKRFNGVINETSCKTCAMSKPSTILSSRSIFLKREPLLLFSLFCRNYIASRFAHFCSTKEFSVSLSHFLRSLVLIFLKNKMCDSFCIVYRTYIYLVLWAIFIGQ